MAHSDHQFAELLDRFKILGIPVVPLKGGTAFSRTIYPDPAVRPGSDMDFLVRPERRPLGPARRSPGTGIGYRCRVDYYAISPGMFSESEFDWLDHPRKAGPSSSTGRCIAPGLYLPRTSGSCSPGSGSAGTPRLRFETMDRIDSRSTRLSIWCSITGMTRGSSGSTTSHYSPDRQGAGRLAQPPGEEASATARGYPWKNRCRWQSSGAGLELPPEFRDFTTLARPFPGRGQGLPAYEGEAGPEW